MKIEPILFADHLGRMITLNNVEVRDIDEIADFLKEVSSESPFYLLELDEIQNYMDELQATIRDCLNNPKAILLRADMPDDLVGICLIQQASKANRCAHRCNIGSLVHRQYWNTGAINGMIKPILEIALQMGYEQAETVEMATDTRSINLCEWLGFKSIGNIPNYFKYDDGSYADAVLLMKKLKS